MTGKPKPALDVVREQIREARALSHDQPGVIRISCFDAEKIVEALAAARRYATLVPVKEAKGSIPLREKLMDALRAVEGGDRD